MIKYPRNYCVFDFETTGLSPENDHIIEIGALKVESGKPDELKSWLIKWPDVRVSFTTVELTGITQEMVDKDGQMPETAFRDFIDFVQGLPMIGHNVVRFDFPFLFSNLHRLGMGTNYYGPETLTNCVDTAAIIKAKKLGEDRRWNETFHEFASRVLEIKAYGVKYNVALCCEELGIDKSLGQAHRAGGDVVLTNEIYKKICLNQ